MNEPVVDVMFQSHDPKSGTGLGTLTNETVPYDPSVGLDAQAAAIIAECGRGRFVNSYHVRCPVGQEPLGNLDCYKRSPGERPYPVDEDFLNKIIPMGKEWQQASGGVVIYRNHVMDSSTRGLVMVRPALDENGSPQPLMITKMASQVFCVEDLIKPEEDVASFFSVYASESQPKPKRKRK